MQNTTERFNPNAEQGRIEQGQPRPEGRLRALGKKFMGALRRELGFQTPEGRSASEQLRANLKQTREASPHRVAAEAFAAAPAADRVDLGHHTHTPTMEARFRNPAPAHAEQGQPAVIDGLVTGVEFVPVPRTHAESIPQDTHVEQGRERYGRHDSGETRESAETGAHYKEGTLMSERNLALQKPPKQFESVQGVLNEEPYVREQYHDQSEIIGTDAWHKAQEETPAYNPHEVSIGADAEGPVKWLTGAEANAVVQEQQAAVPTMPEQPIAEAKTEDTSGDDEWQARQARRERLLRMQNSVKPGEYTPDVIGAQPTDEEDQHQKAA